MTRHIVVSGGAGFWTEGGMALDLYALQLAGKARPRVCYIPTASGDADDFIEGFHRAFDNTVDTCHLTLFRRPDESPAQMLRTADVIIVGGGSTANMLAVWQVHGIGDLLRTAWRRGAILGGSSAGGLCWFDSGATDSLGFDGALRPLQNGLGFLAGSYCPHYDIDPDRRDAYHEMVATGTLAVGYGIDEFAAAHFVDDRLHAVVSARPGATAHRVERSGTSAVVTPIEAQPLA